jgi:transglutaminase-like putative cysteine protease
MTTQDPEELRKWEFLKQAPTRDCYDAVLRSVVAHFRAVASLTPFPDWALAQLFLALVRDCITYQLDTDRVGREQIDGYTDPYASPLEPLHRGRDDCDAKARMFVALCLAAGIEAEMVPRWMGDKLAHVYARCRVTAPGQRVPSWQYAETILRRARLGETSDNVPRELETGKWLF